MNALGKALVVVALLAALACLGGGVFLIVQRETGTRAQALVTDCAVSGRATHCTGTWIVGGDLLGGNGQVQVGSVEGATSSDVGNTIDVTVSGDTAYSRSLVLPIMLLVLGLLLTPLTALALIPSRLARRVLRR
jgi:hypothetical protein